MLSQKEFSQMHSKKLRQRIKGDLSVQIADDLQEVEIKLFTLANN